MTSTTGLEDGILKKDVLGRVKTPRERREALLAEFDRSGMSGQKFAAWAGIKYPTWASWVQKRRQEAGQPLPPRGRSKSKSPVRWLEAVVANHGPVPESAPSGTTVMIVQGPGGVRLELSEERHVLWAAKLLRHLEVPGPC